MMATVQIFRFYSANGMGGNGRLHNSWLVLITAALTNSTDFEGRAGACELLSTTIGNNSILPFPDLDLVILHFGSFTVLSGILAFLRLFRLFSLCGGGDGRLK